jgi:hypothetical protein
MWIPSSKAMLRRTAWPKRDKVRAWVPFHQRQYPCFVATTGRAWAAAARLRALRFVAHGKA